MAEEVKSWPYDFVTSEDYPLSHQRGTIEGQLLIKDRLENFSHFLIFCIMFTIYIFVLTIVLVLFCFGLYNGVGTCQG